MSILPPYRGRKVYHFTPVSNLPMILAYGLLAPNEQRRTGLPQRSSMWEAVQRHRAAVPIPITPGGTAEDYISFYFCKLSPMLLSIMSSKAVDEDTVIHFEFPIELLLSHPSVFTDSAILPNSYPRFYCDPADLARLDWPSIDSPSWRMPSESLRHARLSELLIHRRAPVDSAVRILVWDSQIAHQVRQNYLHAGKPLPVIETDPSFYFLSPENPRQPAISGPAAIYQAYERTIQQLATELNQSAHAHFSDLTALCQALRDDFACLPETAELEGLKTDNRAHFEDVGAHTRRVVAETRNAREFALLTPHDQRLVEIAAFLHDIGKGPKSRWAAFGGKQQLDPDHPIKALPMLRRILTDEVGQIAYEDAVVICKLVVYHDIIGGILFSGRRLEELLGIFESRREFEMVMALGRADSVAINPSWNHSHEREALRQAFYRHLGDPSDL